jgi:alpha-D-xyloside xylohydrolase
LYFGEQTITVDAPLEKLPLFLRAGGIVPMLRPTIDTMSPTTTPGLVDSYATTPGLLYVRLAPQSHRSSFEVFDGTAIEQTEVGYGTTIQFTEGAEFRFGAVFELQPFYDRSTQVTDNGHAVQRVADQEELDSLERGWFVNGNMAVIKVAPGNHEIRVD